MPQKLGDITPLLQTLCLACEQQRTASSPDDQKRWNSVVDVSTECLKRLLKEEDEAKDNAQPLKNAQLWKESELLTPPQPIRRYYDLNQLTMDDLNEISSQKTLVALCLKCCEFHNLPNRPFFQKKSEQELRQWLLIYWFRVSPQRVA